MAIDTQTILWPGESGTKYKYWIYPIGKQLAAKGGNYIFAKKNAKGHWVPIYIGQTKNLNERFDNHHKADCINRNGATHIHAHLEPSEAARLAEETDLVRRWKPPCNG